MERVKEHLSGNIAVSDHIANCNVCKNTNNLANDFKIVKQCYNK